VIVEGVFSYSKYKYNSEVLGLEVSELKEEDMPIY